APPTITSISPTVIPAGARPPSPYAGFNVVIEGENFAGPPGEFTHPNRVFILGSTGTVQAAPVRRVSATRLEFGMPSYWDRDLRRHFWPGDGFIQVVTPSGSAQSPV